MPQITDVTACPDCDEGLDEYGDPCVACGGWGDLPAAVAARLAFERTSELAFELACTAPGDTNAAVHLVVHCAPPFGSLRLKPLPPREALGIVLAALAIKVSVERVTDAPAPASARPRRVGDWSTQYDTPGGAVVTLIRYTHVEGITGDAGTWRCGCGQRAYHETVYPTAKAAAEAHAAACTEPARRGRCDGAGNGAR